jgi:hypothetical protein
MLTVFMVAAYWEKLYRKRKKNVSQPIIQIPCSILKSARESPQLVIKIHLRNMSSFRSAWELKKRLQFASLQAESNLNNVIFSDITTFR